MFKKTITFMTSLLICSQLFAATEVIRQLDGTNYDSKQAIHSKLEIRLTAWSDAEEQETVLGYYKDYLQDKDSEVFQDALEEQAIKGYLLTSEPTGYIIRYAWSEEVETGERLVFMIAPGLKSINPNIWRDPNPNPIIYRVDNPDYVGFTLVELLINDEGGVFKTSLDTDILVREDNKLSLANFSNARDFAVLN